MSRHTTGTWRYAPELSAVVVISGGQVKAVADFGKTDLPEIDANARLIARAPELLQVLKRILAAHDSGNNGACMGEAVLCKMYADMARDVITRAEGTS